MKLSEIEVGKKVIYTPFKDCSEEQKEKGIITSKNDRYVFVRYGNDVYSKATNPKDLIYIGVMDYPRFNDTDEYIKR